MTLMLAGKNIAILTANGFDENQMTEIQRALLKVKATTKNISPEQGVVNGWQGEGWGHYFPVDAQIGEALGSDFDMLVLPGGERGVTKLKTNAHTRRIISHFMEAAKPVAAIGAGISLLTLAPQSAGRTVSAPIEIRDELASLGLIVSDTEQSIDANLLTADGTDLKMWVEGAIQFFAEAEILMEAA